MVQLCGKQFGSFSRLKNFFFFFPKRLNSNSIPRYIPKRTENTFPHKNLYKNVHNSIIHNSQKVKITQMSMINGLKNETAIQRILFRHEKKWNTDPCYSINESLQHYPKWKKPITKTPIVSFHLNKMSSKDKYKHTR